MSAFLYSPSGSLCVISSIDRWRKDKVLQLLSNISGEPLFTDNVYFILNGRLVDSDQQEMTICDKDVLRVHRRFLGGKGGFGSMLRAIGAQIEKTTSREACRDLSGRRMRDVNDEKKITEWVAKQAERERELAKQKQERMERRRALPKHNFDDQTYTKEIQKNLERIDDALKQGLRASGSTSTKIKQKGSDYKDNISKKRKMWMDDVTEDLEDSDDELTTSAIAGPSTSFTSTSTSTNEESFDLKPRTSNDNSSVIHQESEAFKEYPPHELTVTASSLNVNERMSKDVNSEPSDKNNDKETTEIKPFCINDFKTPEELESIGLDALKEQLMILGLKCGGTLQERAQRLFVTKGKSLDELDPLLFAKASKGKKKQKKK